MASAWQTAPGDVTKLLQLTKSRQKEGQMQDGKTQVWADANTHQKNFAGVPAKPIM